MDDQGSGGLSSLAELNYMRLEAMDLFDYCLTEGKPDRLMNFIEQQIAQEPPRLELLREVCEDLHERLMGLHDNYLDVWQRTLDSLRRDFGLKIGKDRASKPFYKFDVNTIIQQMHESDCDISEYDEALLRRMLTVSFETATQLRADITMTERMYLYICDWVDGLNATVARRYWAERRNDNNPGNVH